MTDVEKSGPEIEKESRDSLAHTEMLQRGAADEHPDIQNSLLTSLLDEMDEMVYVSDPATHEIIYANRAARRGNPDVKGRKCHEVLQNIQSPCRSCDNERIFGKNVGKTHHWRFHNPENHRSYKCMAKATMWHDGRLVRYAVASDITEDEEIKEALKEAETKYRALVEQIPAVAYVARLDGTWFPIYISPQIADLLGFTQEEGNDDRSLWARLLHPEDKERVLAAYARTRETGEPLDINHRMITRSGNVVWIHNRASIVCDNSGKPLFLHGVLLDITEREKTNEQVRIISNALASAISGIGFTDPEGRLTYINESCVRMWGHSDAKQVLGRMVTEFWQDEADAARILNIVQHDGAWIGEVVAKRADGSLFDVELSANLVRDEAGKPICLMGSFLDITEQKRIKRELEGMLKLYQSTVANIPAALLVLDARSKVILASRRFCEDLHLSAADVIGKDVSGVLRPTEFPDYSLLDHINSVLETNGWDERLGIRQTSANRPDRYVDIHICSMQHSINQAGEPNVLLVIHDSTRQRILEEQLARAAKMESIGRLAGGVAHDFNNILTGIMGHTHLLAAQVEEGTVMSQKLAQIRKLSERAAGLTRQLLAFAQRQPMQPIVLNINVLIESTFSMLHQVIGEDILFEFKPAPDLSNVCADPTQMEQVLMNLVVNARDAMPNGGKLSIETHNIILGKEHGNEVPGIKDGPTVLLSVTDTGHGMNEETLSHMFEPFFTTKGVGKGTGLGMATAYGIVQQHDGTIQVKSKPGEGTTFLIYLPRVEAQAELLHTSTTPVVVSHGTETLLLVEDEDEVRDTARIVLQGQGYEILTAATPHEAEHIMAQRGKDVTLLVTDAVLPECSGPELYRRLLEQYPSLKVLYISGYPQDAIVHLGNFDLTHLFLRKPFTPDELATKIRQLLDAE